LIASRWKLCSEGEILFVFSENVSLALYAQALDFVTSLLYPPKSRAKPDALYVDPLILNTVFQFETLFVFLIWIVPAARDEHGSGLDRTGSGLKPILAGSGLDRTVIFCKLSDQDWIGLTNFFLYLCDYSEHIKIFSCDAILQIC